MCSASCIRIRSGRILQTCCIPAVLRPHPSCVELQVVGEADVSVKGMLEEFGVYLKPNAFKQDVKPLLKESCSSIFGNASGLTDMLVRHLPVSRIGTATKVQRPATCSRWQLFQIFSTSCMTGRCCGRPHHLSALHKPAPGVLERHQTAFCARHSLVYVSSRAWLQTLGWALALQVFACVPDHKARIVLVQVERLYTGPQDSEVAEHMRSCNPKGPLVVHIAKLFPKTDASGFDAFGRVLSGTIRPGDRVSRAPTRVCSRSFNFSTAHWWRHPAVSIIDSSC